MASFLYCFPYTYRSSNYLIFYALKGVRQKVTVVLSLSPLRARKSDYYRYCDSWKSGHLRFTENGSRRNIAQLWKLFSYITIRILKISFRNCVSSSLCKHYMTFLFTGLFDLTKGQSL
jgi:hypothetical protein